MPKEDVKFGRIVEDESSWVQRWSYDPSTEIFTYYTQKKPFEGYSYYVSHNCFVQFILLVLKPSKGGRRSWGSAISTYINDFRRVTDEEQVVKTFEHLRSTLPASERATMLHDMNEYFKNYLTK